MRSVVGIDPGLHGGMAFIDASGVVVRPMPLSGGEIDGRQIANYIRNVIDYSNVVVAIEKVNSMPGQGVASVFTFGEGFGILKGVCFTLGVRFELVTPQAWKKLVLAGLLPAKPVLPKGATAAQKKAAKAAHKRAQKEAAIAWCGRAYPSVSLIPESCRTAHDGCADALCIAEFARRTYA